MSNISYGSQRGKGGRRLELRRSYRARNTVRDLTREQRDRVRWFERGASDAYPLDLGNIREMFWDKDIINAALGN